MKFASIQVDQSSIPVVATPTGRLLALPDVDASFDSLRAFLEAGDEALELVRDRRLQPGVETISPDLARFSAPITNPSKMLFIALNNTAIDEHLKYRPDFPAYFPKLPSALLGHEGELEVLSHHGLTHPEPELGVVIGKKARDVPLDRALDCVFGYTIVNDVTSVAMRKEDVLIGYYPMPNGDGTFKLIEESFLYPGRYKNVDGFCPMGPYVHQKAAVPDPMNLDVRAWVDDELVISDNTRNLHFSVEEVIYWISHHQTLLPGDVISLGTCVDANSISKPLSYSDISKSGREMRVEIEGLGELRTRVRRSISNPDPRAYFAENKRFKARS